jgi:catalase
MWKLLAAITVALSIVSLTGAIAQEGPASQKSLPEQIVDAMNAVFGTHPGSRATHAKGVVLEGVFTPAASAPRVSKAAHLQKQKTPILVTVRFSDSTGVPNIPDTDPGTSPRGMALKFKLPDGSNTDIVGHSFNGFPVATAAELRDFFLAIGASKPGDPQPTALDTFLSSHPTAKAFVTTQKPAPVSYATLGYFGVNTFKFTNAKGTVTFGRYQLQPAAGEQFVDNEQASKMGPDYLTEEIRERVRRGPIKFNLLLQVSAKDDKLDDPSIAWPDSRKKIELGTIEITKAVPDSQAAEKKLLFTPGALLPGIEAADPMIGMRSAAYIVSLSRRVQTQ